MKRLRNEKVTKTWVPKKGTIRRVLLFSTYPSYLVSLHLARYNQVWRYARSLGFTYRRRRRHQSGRAMGHNFAPDIIHTLPSNKQAADSLRYYNLMPRQTNHVSIKQDISHILCNKFQTLKRIKNSTSCLKDNYASYNLEIIFI